MAFKPDYLSATQTYIDKEGRPTPQFLIFWQKFINALRDAIDGLAEAVTAIGEAEADIITAANDIAALETPQYLTLATTGVLTSERRLVGGTGVAITDGGAGGDATIQIDTVTDLGYTPADKAGDTFDGDVDVTGEIRADALRLDIAPTASVATVTHTIPINVNGTTYYMILSNVA